MITDSQALLATENVNLAFTPEGITRTAQAIEAETGLDVMLFPKLEEYFIGFRVPA